MKYPDFSSKWWRITFGAGLIAALFLVIAVDLVQRRLKFVRHGVVTWGTVIEKGPVRGHRKSNVLSQRIYYSYTVNGNTYTTSENVEYYGAIPDAGGRLEIIYIAEHPEE